VISLATLNFEVTTKCNLSCIHCLRDKLVSRHLEKGLVEKVLKQIEGYGINRVGFTGGEPLVHPEFMDIIEMAVRMGNKVAFVTNGIRLPQYVDFLARPEIKDSVDRISISIDGVSEASNDKIRGKGSFKKALKGLLACESRGLPFAIKFTLNALNYKELEAITLMASKLGARQLQFSHLYPTPDNIRSGLLLEPGQWQSIQDEHERLKNIVRIPLVFSSVIQLNDRLPICMALAMMEYYVDSRGWLCLCCMLPGVSGRKAGEKEKDRLADLHTTSFVDAHRKLIELIKKLRLKSIKRIESGKVSRLEHYFCLHCAFQLGKLDWLSEYHDSTWAKMFDQARGEKR